MEEYKMVSNIKKSTKKRLYSVDDFIDSALGSHQFPRLNKISASGFRAQMAKEDKVLISDEQEFLKALKDYLK
ncbi:hypothetical protein LpeD_14 [Lactobacillus phage LpeD]|uniref:Uncharacterized protein n=1 Tax=Lactobacillus phage LpeD TaxID=2041210 RepID=A0A291I9F9_9CAUD|nr:hypothetical protein HWB32_gp013 [Lactobacillus phage LpeD]ATG86323.1 hypothetical protein LpeD_14 [Lactobacillus phage LpeD]